MELIFHIEAICYNIIAINTLSSAFNVKFLLTTIIEKVKAGGAWGEAYRQQQEVAYLTVSSMTSTAAQLVTREKNNL